VKSAAQHALSIVKGGLSQSERSLFHWLRAYIHVKIVLIATFWVPYICIYEITPTKASEIFVGENVPVRDLTIKKQKFITSQYFVANVHGCRFTRKTFQWPIWHALSHRYGRWNFCGACYSPMFWYISDNQHSCGQIFYDRRRSAVIDYEIFYPYMAHGIGILCFKLSNLCNVLNERYIFINENIWLFEHGQGVFRDCCGFFCGIGCTLRSGDRGLHVAGLIRSNFRHRFDGLFKTASLATKYDQLKKQNYGRRYSDENRDPIIPTLLVFVASVLLGFLLVLFGSERLDNERRVQSAALIGFGLLLTLLGVGLCLYAFLRDAPDVF
jgi:hypothetical protein